MLGKIMIAKERLDEAAEHLEHAQLHAQQLQHQRHLAEVQQVWGRLYYLLGNFPAARAALIEAVDLFERLSLRRELAEARKELQRLDVSEVSLA
jgi:tetratricopeptide (TPR) repeat protein